MSTTFSQELLAASDEIEVSSEERELSEEQGSPKMTNREWLECLRRHWFGQECLCVEEVAHAFDAIEKGKKVAEKRKLRFDPRKLFSEVRPHRHCTFLLRRTDERGHIHPVLQVKARNRMEAILKCVAQNPLGEFHEDFHLVKNLLLDLKAFVDEQRRIENMAKKGRIEMIDIEEKRLDDLTRVAQNFIETAELVLQRWSIGLV